MIPVGELSAPGWFGLCVAFAGLDAATVAVLVVGAATVIAQVYAAHLGRKVSRRQTEVTAAQLELARQQESREAPAAARDAVLVERQTAAAEAQASVARAQAEVAEAARRHELGAVLVATFSGLSTGQLDMTLHNGGRFAASDIEVFALDESDHPVGSARVPLVAPGSAERLAVPLRRTPEARMSVERAGRVSVSWQDGLGRHRKVPLPLLRA